ncbi:uncharacterized protein LOC100377770 [Saccoglossus kowalevskii]
MTNCKSSLKECMFQIDIAVLQIRDQIRESDPVFLKSLVTNMVEFADEAYQPLCVVVKEVGSAADFDKKKVNGYNYHVIGGQHCLLATKEIAKTAKYLADERFKSRNCVVYAGLTTEQQRWLAVKHNSTGEFRHAITLKDKVDVCRRHRGDVPDEDKFRWKASCGLILNEKKGSQNLEVVCYLASLNPESYGILKEIFEMYEEGSLKKQKRKNENKSNPDIPPYVFRPLRSLDNETVTLLLKDVKEKKLSIQELKEESQSLYKMSHVQKAFVQLMDLNSWDEAVAKFPTETTRDALVRFSTEKFRPTIPDIFVNHCQRLRIENLSDSREKTPAIIHGRNSVKAFIVNGNSMEIVPEELTKITGHVTGFDLVILDTPQVFC